MAEVRFQKEGSRQIVRLAFAELCRSSATAQQRSKQSSKLAYPLMPVLFFSIFIECVNPHWQVLSTGVLSLGGMVGAAVWGTAQERLLRDQTKLEVLRAFFEPQPLLGDYRWTLDLCLERAWPWPTSPKDLLRGEEREEEFEQRWGELRGTLANDRPFEASFKRFGTQKASRNKMFQGRGSDPLSGSPDNVTINVRDQLTLTAEGSVTAQDLQTIFGPSPARSARLTSGAGKIVVELNSPLGIYDATTPFTLAASRNVLFQQDKVQALLDWFLRGVQQLESGPSATGFTETTGY